MLRHQNIILKICTWATNFGLYTVVYGRVSKTKSDAGKASNRTMGFLSVNIRVSVDISDHIDYIY